MDKPKHVYLIGTKDGHFHAHTYSKKDLKLFMKYRKGFKWKKVKNTLKFQQDLSINTEIVFFGGLPVSAFEEEYFLESFTQFIADSARSYRSLLKGIKCIKFNEVECEHIKSFRKFSKYYLKYTTNDENEMDEVYNYNRAIAWFIKHILDIGEKK